MRHSKMFVLSIQRNIRNWMEKITTLDYEMPHTCNQKLLGSLLRPCILLIVSLLRACIQLFVSLHIALRVLVVCLPQCWYASASPPPIQRHWLQPLQMEALGITVQMRVAQPQPPAAPPPTFSSTATTYGSCSLLGQLALQPFPHKRHPHSPVDMVCSSDARHKERTCCSSIFHLTMRIV